MYETDNTLKEWFSSYFEQFRKSREMSVKTVLPHVKTLLINYDGKLNAATEYWDSEIMPEYGGFEIRLRGSRTRIGTAFFDNATKNITFYPSQNHQGG